MDFRVGIDQSLSFTGVTVMSGEKELIKQYGITHKKHAKWDKFKKAHPDFSLIDVIDYEYKEKTPEMTTYEIERVKTDNLIELTNTISDIIEECTRHGKTTVYMEGVSFGSRQTTAIAELAALNYYIRKVCLCASAEFVIIPPSKVKKYFTGNGVADKELMMETYFQLVPEARQVKDILKLDDIADSYAMACFDE